MSLPKNLQQISCVTMTVTSYTGRGWWWFWYNLHIYPVTSLSTWIRFKRCLIHIEFNTVHQAWRYYCIITSRFFTFGPVCARANNEPCWANSLAPQAPSPKSSSVSTVRPALLQNPPLKRLSKANITQPQHFTSVGEINESVLSY